jgi:hypothetical protein
LRPDPTLPRPLSDFALAYAGRPAVVMGGGMSLPEQASRTITPDGWIRFAANEHAAKIGIRCDFIVSVDNIPEKVLPFGVPVITTRRWGQIRMFKQPSPVSGVCAAWAAWVMGCAPIVLLGMDLYVGGTYCHDPKAKSSGNAVSFAHHVSRWEKLKQLLPAAPIYVVDGPLLKVFPQYRGKNTGFALPERAAVLKQTAGIVVAIRKPIEFKPHSYAAGMTAELTESEARQALRANAGVILKGAVCA